MKCSRISNKHRAMDNLFKTYQIDDESADTIEKYITTNVDIQWGYQNNVTFDRQHIEHQQKELVEKNEQINELLPQQDQNQQIIMSLSNRCLMTYKKELIF